jgi:F-type H+-transporting ATPase subunit a
MEGHFQRHVLLRLPTVFGADLSITNEVLLLWAAAAVTFLLLRLACGGHSLAPRGVFRNLFEGLYEFVDRSVVRECLGAAGGGGLAAFVLTLFFFILSGNLLGMLPLPYHVRAATANLNVTVPLALMVFVVTIGVGVRRRGMGGFLRGFAPSGVPMWVLPLLVPIEVLSWLARPFSLAVRLFANMLAGHALLAAFVGMAATVPLLLKPLPYAGAVMIDAFEMFVCFIQAFIFATLTALYLREAGEETH